MIHITNTPDRALLEQLGGRLAARRIARRLTQKTVAGEAGVALRTIQRIEAGAAATQLSHFLRVARVLGLIDRIDDLIPEAVASPIAELRTHGAKPARVRERPAGTQGKAWTWADDA